MNLIWGKNSKKTFIWGWILVVSLLQHQTLKAQYRSEEVVTGAERMELYLPALKGKNIGVVANHASRIGNRHLVDSLISSGVHIRRIFSPEHGFRGIGDAGEHLSDEFDRKTGIQIVSLYGDNKEPSSEQVSDLDIIVFDLQDVGVRFYTYISTLTYVMKACAQNGVSLIVLDRPNPNGHYVDGPVLESRYTSFVGLHEIPIVYGMTIGEYARMVKGEGWNQTSKCNLSVIPLLNYDHKTYYELPVKPSPNLPNMTSIYLYPSLCLFEGTVVSIGRGTDKPFQVIGHPDFVKGNFKFIPTSMAGAKSPKLMDRTCNGVNLSEYSIEKLRKGFQLNLSYLIDFYTSVPNKKDFFNEYFNLLAGNATLKLQITEGMAEEEIRKSWAYDLEKFKKIREKYLLYNDFEHRIELK